MAEVTPNFKTNAGECGCGEEACSEYGPYRKRPGRSGNLCCKTCTACQSCRNGSSSSRGNRSQRKVAHKLGVALQTMGGGWEQFWRAVWRVEVKDDKAAQKVVDFYDDTKAQSDKDKSIGDWRPYVAIATRSGRTFAVVNLDDMDNAAHVWLEGRQ